MPLCGVFLVTGGGGVCAVKLSWRLSGAQTAAVQTAACPQRTGSCQTASAAEEAGKISPKQAQKC